MGVVYVRVVENDNAAMPLLTSRIHLTKDTINMYNVRFIEQCHLYGATVQFRHLIFLLLLLLHFITSNYSISLLDVSFPALHHIKL